MPYWIEITSMDSFHGTYFDFPDVYSEYSDKGKKETNLTTLDLCEGNYSVIGGFIAQWASNADNVFM